MYTSMMYNLQHGLQPTMWGQLHVGLSHVQMLAVLTWKTDLLKYFFAF